MSVEHVSFGGVDLGEWADLEGSEDVAEDRPWMSPDRGEHDADLRLRFLALIRKVFSEIHRNRMSGPDGQFTLCAG